jgi:hypothetical protein
MNYGKVLTWCVVILEFGASIGYMVHKDWRYGLYWLFAALIGLTLVLGTK